MSKPKKPNLGRQLRQKGFDRSYYNRSTGGWHAGCSQCNALVIQGVPCHERGCPNKK